ncbi:DUF2214 domain-containing protein [Pseudoroseomonas deserti]|uniref:DUF2214 domain-containing protein n=1 Tax=Teichococcus deserti TaxID=1817963 RepID=A0A1V2H3S4_9PROT|nr:DUF6644 family protein [Pseudoroseomonas deserti]ONG55531.1 DUF2214 domain-containing protein [Pseudoroseomonas deserti]
MLALLEHSAPALLLRQSAIAYPLANAAHILSIALLIGAIATLDLRLLGFFRAAPLAVLAPPLVRIAGLGLAFALATGAFLFIVRPGAYLANPAFLAKLALVALGIGNAALQHRRAGWHAALDGARPTVSVKLGAAASLAIWVAALLAGRWIGFVE